MGVSYQSIEPILKRIYGPRLHALGTYRQVATLFERDRFEARREAAGKKRRSFGQLAREVGCEVHCINPITELFYRRTPFLALIKGAPPPDPRLSSSDVSWTRRGKHGESLRSPFPEEQA